MKRKAKALACAIFLALAERLWPNPNGGTVVGGQATIGAPGPNQIIEQHSDRAIIDWQNFNINQNEITQFIQPSPDSIIVNRVTGHPSISVIDGQLKANGQVWLINPSGILFGRNAMVDVAKLHATTANVDTTEFLQNRQGPYKFTPSPDLSAAIVNEGTIKVKDTGMVSLVAPGVENSGFIIANRGEVHLASGTYYTFDPYGDGKIQFAVAAGSPSDINVKPRTVNGRELNHAIHNSGSITAGKVVIQASDASRILEHVINMEGIVRAETATLKGGEIILSAGNNGNVKVTGTLDASSKQTVGQMAGKDKGKGGKIVVTGKNVWLTGDAILDVSGNFQGGEIYIGGGLKGLDPTIQNATNTTIDRDVRMFANTVTEGKGGKVILYANKDVKFYGQLDVSGGKNGGLGGFVETSGKFGKLDLGDTVAGLAPLSTRMRLGKGGDWLIDPFNVFISTAASSNGAFTFGAGTADWTPSGNNSNIIVTDINDFLNFGTRVTINTSGGGGAQAGLITVNAPITVITAGTTPLLIFNADSNIVINSPISTQNGAVLQLQFNASGQTILNSGISTGGGNFTNTSVGYSQASGVTVDVGGGTATISGGGGAINFNSGSLNAGAVTVSNASTVNLGNVTTGTFNLNNALGNITGAITQTAGTLLNIDTINLTSTGSVSLGQNNIIAGSAFISNTSANAVSINTVGGLNFGASALSGSLTATATGPITQSGSLAVTGTSSFSAGANPITLTNGGNMFGSAVSASNSGSNGVTISAGDGLPLGLINVGADFTGAAGTTMRLTNNITSGGALSLTAPSGMILTNSINISSGSNMVFTGTINGGFNLTLNATPAGNITLNGAVGNTTRLGAFNITSVNNFTNGATLNSTTYNQAQGSALCNLGSSTLNTTGNAVINSQSIVGNVAIGGSLTIGAQTANLTGTVGILPILFTSGTEPTQAGTHFFNGVDLFGGGQQQASATQAAGVAQDAVTTITTGATTTNYQDQITGGANQTTPGTQTGGQATVSPAPTTTTPARAAAAPTTGAAQAQAQTAPTTTTPSSAAGARTAPAAESRLSEATVPHVTETPTQVAPSPGEVPSLGSQPLTPADTANIDSKMFDQDAFRVCDVEGTESLEGPRCRERTIATKDIQAIDRTEIDLPPEPVGNVVEGFDLTEKTTAPVLVDAQMNQAECEVLEQMNCDLLAIAKTGVPVSSDISIGIDAGLTSSEGVPVRIDDPELIKKLSVSQILSLDMELISLQETPQNREAMVALRQRRIEAALKLLSAAIPGTKPLRPVESLPIDEAIQAG